MLDGHELRPSITQPSAAGSDPRASESAQEAGNDTSQSNDGRDRSGGYFARSTREYPATRTYESATLGRAEPPIQRAGLRIRAPSGGMRRRIE